MPLFGRKKGKYNLLSNERSSNKSKNNACKKKDYKCKYVQCERARINMKGRPLPSLPRQKTRKSSKEENIYDSIVGGTRRRKHVTKSAHKKRGYGKRSMRKRGKRSMRKRGRKVMRG